MISSAALDGSAQDLPGLFVGLFLSLSDLSHTASQLFLLTLESVGLLVQGFFFLLQPALLLAQFAAALFDFFFVFCAERRR